VFICGLALTETADWTIDNDAGDALAHLPSPTHDAPITHVGRQPLPAPSTAALSLADDATKAQPKKT